MILNFATSLHNRPQKPRKKREKRIEEPCGQCCCYLTVDIVRIMSLRINNTKKNYSEINVGLIWPLPHVLNFSGFRPRFFFFWISIFLYFIAHTHTGKRQSSQHHLQRTSIIKQYGALIRFITLWWSHSFCSLHQEENSHTICVCIWAHVRTPEYYRPFKWIDNEIEAQFFHSL